MRTICRTLWPAVLLAVILAGCSSRPTPLEPAPSATTPAPTAPAQTTTDVAPALTLTAAPTPSPVVKPPAVDATPPTVSLATDLLEVPWQGQTTVHVTAEDDQGVVGLAALLDNQVLATAEDGDLSFDLIPGVLDGVKPGSAYTITARATDAAGNVGTATLAVRFGPAPETPTPAGAAASPTGTPSPRSGTLLPDVSATGTPVLPATIAPVAPSTATLPAPVTSYRVIEINLPTYPYAPFLRPSTDPALGGYPVAALDRAAYELSNPQPSPVTYRMIVLENRYLRLGILPDLGGRIYECTFKPTGNNEFYSNPVVKPTGWGPPGPPYPAGANWWLGAGGLEWGFPVEEHGYEWGTRLGLRPRDAGQRRRHGHGLYPRRPAVSLRRGGHHPAARYGLLRRAAAYHQPVGRAVQVQVVGERHAGARRGEQTRRRSALYLPGCRGDRAQHRRPVAARPGPADGVAGDQRPRFEPPGQLDRVPGRLPAAGRGGPGPSGAEGFMGVYDTAADEGMLRIYPSDVAKGAKLFSAGWSNPLDWHLWTDDGSGYVELHGGLEPTFDDWHELPPGGEITWSEIWYPVAGIGGVTYANGDGALGLIASAGRLKVALSPTTAVRGKLTVSLPGMEPIIANIEASPAQPFAQDIVLPDSVPAQGQVSVTLVDAGGRVQFAYSGTARLR